MVFNDSYLSDLVFERFKSLLYRLKEFDVTQGGGIHWWFDHGALVSYDKDPPSRGALDRRWEKVEKFIAK